LAGLQTFHSFGKQTLVAEEKETGLKPSRLSGKKLRHLGLNLIGY